MVSAQCSNALAVQMAHDMSFQTHHDKIVRDLQHVEEFRQILLLDNSFPSQDFTDMTSTLERLRIGNTVMELPEIFHGTV